MEKIFDNHCMHLVSVFPEWIRQQLSGIDVDLSDEAKLGFVLSLCDIV